MTQENKSGNSEPVCTCGSDCTPGPVHRVGCPSREVHDSGNSELVAALRSGRQADPDGVMVTVSREACERAAALLEAFHERGGGVAGDPEPLIAAGMKLVEALAFYSPERVRLGRPVKQWREALAAFKGVPFEDTGLNTYEPTPPHSRRDSE